MDLMKYIFKDTDLKQMPIKAMYFKSINFKGKYSSFMRKNLFGLMQHCNIQCLQAYI